MVPRRDAALEPEVSFDPVELGFIRILRGLSSKQVLDFLDACKVVDVPANSLLVEEGEDDDAMLILLEGTLEVFVGRSPDVTILKTVRRGDYLGELSLLGLAQQRTASIRSLEPCDLLVLERTGYERLVAAGHPVVDRLEEGVLHALADRIREVDARIGLLAEGTDLDQAEPETLWARLAVAVVGAGPRGRAPKAVEVLATSPHFRDLPAELRSLLAAQMEPVAATQGERILDEGSMRGDAWLLATGEVGVYRATRSALHEKVGTLKPGALFGHLAIINDDTRTATCVADQACWLYKLPREICKTLMESASPEGKALRRSFIHALSWQLQQANGRLALVSRDHAARIAARDDLATEEIERVKEARKALVSAE